MNTIIYGNALHSGHFVGAYIDRYGTPMVDPQRFATWDDMGKKTWGYFVEHGNTWSSLGNKAKTMA